MSNQPVVDKELPKRPLHVSVASLGTNASGIAGSTISYAGSDLSGISQFPAPPGEIPTPTLSRVGTPASYNFTIRLPPSVPDYETPSRFHFGTPPTPGSPVVSLHSSNPNAQDSRNMKSVPSSKFHDPNTAGTSEVLPTRRQPPNPLPTLPSHPLASYQPIRPLTYRKDLQPFPPVSERALSKRPETPHSVAAASSLLDWSDATSGISIDPSEERLLTTSFITSLLSQAPDPFPGDKLHKSRNRAVSGAGKGSHQLPQTEEATEASGPHQSIPLFYPSDLLSAESGDVDNARATVPEDQRSAKSDSRCASRDCSETAHTTTEGQVQSAVRGSSIIALRGGNEAHPVGVMPAFRIASDVQKSDSSNISLVASNNSVITSATMASKPPVHRADAPRNVRHTGGFGGFGGFDGDGISRESYEDIGRLAGGSLRRGQPGIASSSRQPVANFQKRTSRSHSRSRVDPSSSRPTLQRNHSIKSVVSSVVSRISNSSAIRRAKYTNWLRQRPLPPIPISSNPPEVPNGKEIQISEEVIPLPTLVKRAGDLSGMLNRGRLPDGADNHYEFQYQGTFVPFSDPRSSYLGTYVQIDTKSTVGQRSSLFSRIRKHKEESYAVSAGSPSSAKASAFDKRRKRRRLLTVVVVVILGMALAIALPVGLSQRSSSTVTCNGNQTGASCTLDATCVCTSNSGSCKPLARSLLLLLNDVNDIFASDFSGETMSDAVASAAGVTADGLCRNQALLIDVEPGLNSAQAPNRTKWAQAAMLWNLGISEDISQATALQKFVSTAPWSSLSNADGPVDDGGDSFAFSMFGFTFNFASQSVAPLSATFRQSSPSDAQLAAVSGTAEKVLDRMYSFAIASSTQRKRALANYWTSVLQRQRSELDSFKDAVKNSAFLVPFDATSSPGGNPLTDRMSNTSSTQFPIPISCYPGLDEAQLTRINALETTAFGLDPSLATSDFSQFCIRDRPVYGIVNLLRSRLPFSDDREGAALQGSALSNDAMIRAVIYSGEVLSAFPGATILPRSTSKTTDPREFGTVDFLDHVLLNYFSSISNVSVAMDFVSHVLSSNPLADNPALANSLSSLPVLEFAVFGIVRPQDIAFSVSSFSTEQGSLFFGSNASETFRSWALVNSSASISWAESAISSEVVREGSTRDEDFESVWEPASELVASGSTDADDVRRVTSSLRSLGLFSP